MYSTSVLLTKLFMQDSICLRPMSKYFVSLLSGLIITGGHDNLILVWSIESLGRVMLQIFYFSHVIHCS